MLCDQHRSCSPCLEPFGYRAVKCDPPGPSNLAVERFAYQGMTECHAAGIGFDGNPAA
jgi:hypothetical protein